MQVIPKFYRLFYKENARRNKVNGCDVLGGNLGSTTICCLENEIVPLVCWGGFIFGKNQCLY